MFRIDTISDLEFEFFDRVDVDPMASFLGRSSKNNHFEVKTGHRVTANIATHPPRFEKLLRTLESIDGQFDEIRIYLNNYSGVPQELSGYSTYLGPDLTDNAKFLWSHEPGEYYFTLDDDIVYPSDYVDKTIGLIGDRVVSYHGRRLYGKGQRYYDNHRVYSYFEGLKQEVVLDVAGTGVMAFDTDVFSPALWRTPNYRMTDLVVSLEAHLSGIDLVCLPRQTLWLGSGGGDFDGIYWEERDQDEPQRRFADMILSYRGANRDVSVLNDRFSEVSLEFLSGRIDGGRLLVLRFGDGHVAEWFSRRISVVAFDTERRRVDGLCDTDVEYVHVRDYSEVDYEVGDFVFLDDRFLPSRISSEVHRLLPNSCRLLCTSFVDGAFPTDRVPLLTESGKEITFFVYDK